MNGWRHVMDFEICVVWHSDLSSVCWQLISLLLIFFIVQVTLKLKVPFAYLYQNNYINWSEVEKLKKKKKQMLHIFLYCFRNCVLFWVLFSNFVYISVFIVYKIVRLSSFWETSSKKMKNLKTVFWCLRKT